MKRIISKYPPPLSKLVALTAALIALLMTGQVWAQNIGQAAEQSSVLNTNPAKGITNGETLINAILGAPAMDLPIKTTGYFAGGISTGINDNLHQGASLGTLGLGARRCPFVNAHREEATYMPGTSFRVNACWGHNNFWVGIRVYGMICSASDPITNCQSLENGIVNPEQYNSAGYIALLKPGVECGPEKWPTEALRRAGAPAYAEWCDYGVKVP